MVVIWQTILLIIMCPIGRGARRKLEPLQPSEWRAIEDLSEEYPYIVALLDHQKQYSCTGVSIQSQTVLTTGSCVKYSPRYIIHGAAVVDKHPNANTLLTVTKTSLHPDYSFHMKTEVKDNVTSLHSNLGIVYTDKPIMDFYVADAFLGNYYAAELKDKILKVVGYGKLSEGSSNVLQQQMYRQAPCADPKWYYCVCGFEFIARSMPLSYEMPFGEGAPVLLGKEIVALSVTPCGTLELPSSNYKYNIFTVIGPYTSWIHKDYVEHLVALQSLRSKENITIENTSLLSWPKNNHEIIVPHKYIWILLLLSKFLFNTW